MDEFEFRKMIARHVPQYRDVGYFYKQLLQQYVTPNARILSIGCGFRFYVPEFFSSQTQFIVGVDQDPLILERNDQIENLIITPLATLPFQSHYFDLIIAEWVFEHVADPEEVVSALARVLRPGGVVIFMTSNLTSPIMMLSRCLPDTIHAWYRKRLLSVPFEETCPTRYRMNTEKRLRELFARYGFSEACLRKVGVLTYFRFHPLALRFGMFLERLSEIRGFSFLKAHMAGVFRLGKRSEDTPQTADAESSPYQCFRCRKELIYEFRSLRCAFCSFEMPAKLKDYV